MVKMDAVWIKVTILFLCSDLVSGSVCSYENRTNNLGKCLYDTKAILTDTTRFWFGTPYRTNCPNGVNFRTNECYNDNPDTADSLATRVFPLTGQLDLALIDRYLSVSFRNPPGSYKGCENTVTSDTTWFKSFDPTQLEVVHGWNVRLMPDLVWSYSPGEYYTVAVYDAGFFFMHGIYTNILGNNIAAADLKDPYSGPLVTTNVENPFIFMVFKQAEFLTLTAEWEAKLANPMTNYTVPEFVEAANLTGPIAVNWFVAAVDEYSAQTMQDLGIISACSNLVALEMNKRARPFLPNNAQLSVWVNVTFSPTYLNFEACCSRHVMRARDFNLNPLGNAMFKTAETRSEAPPTITFLKKGLFFLASNFAGTTYTLLAIDPDVPYPDFATEEKPLLHMMYINIKNGDTSTGDAVRVWRGPGPPDNLPHYYYFLLYEQQPGSVLSVPDMQQYAGDACRNEQHPIPYRCLYDINKMVSDNSLKLVGASWMLAEKDEYVIYRNLQTNPDDVSNQCQGQPGYVTGCPIDTTDVPTDAAPISVMQSFNIMMLCSIVSYLLILLH